MFRVLLTTLLMTIVALQHGICFCHYVDAFVSQDEAACAEVIPCNEVCCDSQQPTPPTKSTTLPTQNHEDEDSDCPCCKLRQSLAYTPVPLPTEQEGGIPFVTVLSTHEIAEASANFSCANGSAQFSTLDGPVPLILCALRI
jgi:hypothetical protein